MLAARQWKPKDIAAVLVSRGPGSYTGLRVGIMSAKTFAYATGCTPLAIDTFLAIARQTSSQARLVDVVEDAQQGKLYVQRFVRGDGHGDFQPASTLVIEDFAKWS